MYLLILLGNVADEMVSGDFRCYFHGVPLSRAGRSHAFRRLRAPSRCRECDNLIVSLKGAECVQVCEKYLLIIENGLQRYCILIFLLSPFEPDIVVFI